MVDYVVVGGGSAGCVVAARLAEDPDASVLLLEQGDSDRNPFIHLPVTYYKLFGSRFLEDHHLLPTRAQNDLEQVLVQARVLGGGSSVNGMIYIRGCPQDYDRWAASGADGWSYSEVLPFFTRSEDNESLAGEAHGSGGLLGVSDIPSPLPLTKDWLKACQDVGLSYNADFNSGRQLGCGLYQLTTRGGRRSSTVGFLREGRRRGNLSVETKVRVLRILVEKGRAVGVEYLRRGKVVRVRAEREVIVCAGAIGSPHLLLRSGIGPADHLAAAGVPVVRDLPGVGENFQDHLLVYLTYQLKKATSYDRYKKPHWQAWAGLQYVLFRDGPVTTNLIEAGAFCHSRQNDPLPDLQYFFFPGSAIEHNQKPVPGGNGCSVSVGQSRPRSRGTLRLRSGDPFAPPLVDPGYFNDPYDLQVVTDGVEIAHDMMRQMPIARHVACEHEPGPLRSRRDYEDFVRRAAVTGTHPVGGCRMGKDSMAVVDPQLRVHGIEGLRVADSSIMPDLPSGNTNAPSIMIGERAAAFILSNGSEPRLVP